MKFRTKKIYLDREHKEKGYVIFEESIEYDELKEEEFCHFTFETLYSYFYLKEETVLLIESIFKKHIARGTVKRSNWATGSMHISSPHYIRPVYRYVFHEVWPLLINSSNYNYVPEEKTRR